MWLGGRTHLPRLQHRKACGADSGAGDRSSKANYPAIQAGAGTTKGGGRGYRVAKTAYLPQDRCALADQPGDCEQYPWAFTAAGDHTQRDGIVLPSDPTRSAWNSAGGALLSWQPFDFGARGAKVEVARQGSEAAKQAESLTGSRFRQTRGAHFSTLLPPNNSSTVAQANVQRYESFDKVVHVLVDNTLRPGVDASQADAQLALARNQLIQVQTEVALRRCALAEYLQTTQIPSRDRCLAAFGIAPCNTPADQLKRRNIRQS